MLTPEIKKYIDKSVLCWLATSSLDNIPNVSPKEIFTHYTDDYIIIANIASPQSVKNIKQNENVCLSFIEILIQKGFQIKGKAKILKEGDSDFINMKKLLVKFTEDKFPFKTLTSIKVESVKKILAPSYLFFPETKEKDQIENARKMYGLIN